MSLTIIYFLNKVVGLVPTAKKTLARTRSKNCLYDLKFYVVVLFVKITT